MDCRITILNGPNKTTYFNICSQFFFDPTDKRLLWCFTRFNFPTRELLLPILVTTTTSCGKYLVSVADDRTNKFNDLHIAFRLK